jgi:hypothetical protein
VWCGAENGMQRLFVTAWKGHGFKRGINAAKFTLL